MDQPQAPPISAITVEYASSHSRSSKTLSASISLPTRSSTTSSETNLLVFPTSSTGGLRLSSSDPVMIEKEGSLVLQTLNPR